MVAALQTLSGLICLQENRMVAALQALSGLICCHENGEKIEK